MGLLKSIFGIIGGLFQAIAGLVGLGKKSEFYMELPNAEPLTAASTVPSAPPVIPAETPTEILSPAPLPTAELPPTAPAPKPKALPLSVPSFAATYLITPGATPASRRRPGPSLSPFLTMAKQVKA